MAVLWAPKPRPIEDIELLERVEAMTYGGRAPLAEESVHLLGAISKAILASPFARSQPQYVALGYWLRPAALERMCAHLRERTTAEHSVLAPRGVALHLPPTNVDTIFVYSWAISVLAGNCNIVRLPSAVDAGTEWLAALIADVIAEAGEDGRHLFCQLPQDGRLIANISANSDLRMIWGGDAKVESVSKVPIRPDGLSIGFPDRKSLAVIKTESYLGADEAARDALAAQFFNDIYWFNQMGCGSPRVLYWVGEPGDLSDDLFARLNRHITKKSHITETGVAIGKFAAVNDMLAEELAFQGRTLSNALHVVETHAPGKALMVAHGGGLLAQAVIGSIEEIARDVTRKVQTIAHFGFETIELQRLAHSISGRGGYRLVPIGQALQFDILWDGLDLIQHMTRRVAISN